MEASTPAPPTQPTEKRGGMGPWLIGGGALVLFLGFMGMRVVQSLNKQKDVAAQRSSAAEQEKKAIEYESVHPAPINWRPRVELNGTLKPWREADISFETQGRLVKVGVAVGDVVKQGQLLATLDASRAGAQVNQAQAQVRAAKANVALAEDNLKRTDQLVASKSIPEAQAEQARQNVALAKAQLEAAEASTRLAVVGAGVHSISAPFPGVITKAPANPGGVVNPGVPLIRLEDVSRFRLSGTLGEEEVDLVSVGAKVDVTYRDRVVKGTVTAVVPSLDQATRRAPVEVEVPNDPKAPLMGYGFVRAVAESKTEVLALRVPPTTRRAGSQNELVTVVDGKARIVRVVHGVDGEGNWIVRTGLKETDVLVVNAPPDVKDGDALVLAGPKAQEPPPSSKRPQ
jgi:RND family efflux transporter MFP subunit